MKTAASLVLLASLTAGLACTASAQTFNRVIGLNGHETANGVASTRDGGYVTVGSISNSTVDLGDILVVKYNPDGSFQWASRFGGQGLDVGYSVKQTRDGGYLIGAETNSVGALLNLALLKLDPAGNYQWSRVYEGDQSSEDAVHGPGAGVGIAEVVTTSQVPGYALVGRKRISQTNQAGVMVRTDINGTPISNTRYIDGRFGERTMMTFSDVKFDVDGTLVISGTDTAANATGTSRQDPMIMRALPTGVPVFAISYPTAAAGANPLNNGTGDGLDILSNRDITFNGRNDQANNSQNLHAFRLTPAGNVIWMDLFNRSGPGYRSIQEDVRGDIAMGGWIGNFPAASSGALAVLNPAGNPILTYKYDFLTKAEGTTPCFANVGYALAGTVNLPTPPGYGGLDIELIHTNDAGFVGCLDAPFPSDPSRLPVLPVVWGPVLQQQVHTIWQGEFRRLTLRNEALCITPICPTCPADFNEDGGVDGADINAFFQAWQDGDSCADVNQDGGVDGADIGDFFTLWQNGGC